MNSAMRRIPRTQRSIDQALPLPHLPRHRIAPSPCRAAVAPGPLLRTSCASFSTSPSYASLLSSDKKKHQASIRKWQKRLLGDAEPIGAHVDPYDPTSPIRIAPEEQGEEVEVLAESEVDESGQVVYMEQYVPAETGEGLVHVGDNEYVQDLEGKALDQRFAELVGTQPIARYSFGPEEPITDRKAIVRKFHQAVVEVYTLKQADKDMDLTKYPSRGDYELEGLDFSYVKLSSSPTDDLVLVYPSEEIKLELLNAIANQKSQAAKDEELKKRKDEAEAEVAEFEASEASDLDHAAELEQISDAIEKEIADTRKSVRRHLTSLASKNVTVLTPGTEVTYGKIQVSDPAIKFALSKRLRALTGLRISDPQLYNSRTLSDILSQFIAATKSKPTKVFEKVQLQTELPRLPNVKLHSRQIREEEKERAIGRWKVIEYALTERGLPVYKHEAEDYAPSNDMLRPAAWTVPEPKLVPKPKKVKVLKH